MKKIKRYFITRTRDTMIGNNIVESEEKVIAICQDINEAVDTAKELFKLNLDSESENYLRTGIGIVTKKHTRYVKFMFKGELVEEVFIKEYEF